MSFLYDIQNGIEGFNSGIGKGLDWVVDRTGDVAAGIGNLFGGRDWMNDDQNTSNIRNSFYNATNGDTFSAPVSIAEDVGIGTLGAALAPFTGGASVPVAGGLLAAKTAGEQGKNIDAAVTGKDEQGNDLSWEDRLGKGAIAAGSTALAGLGGGALTKAGGKAATRGLEEAAWDTYKKDSMNIANRLINNANELRSDLNIPEKLVYNNKGNVSQVTQQLPDWQKELLNKYENLQDLYPGFNAKQAISNQEEKLYTKSLPWNKNNVDVVNPPTNLNSNFDFVGSPINKLKNTFNEFNLKTQEPNLKNIVDEYRNAAKNLESISNKETSNIFKQMPDIQNVNYNNLFTNDQLKTLSKVPKEDLTWFKEGYKKGFPFNNNPVNIETIYSPSGNPVMRVPWAKQQNNTFTNLLDELFNNPEQLKRNKETQNILRNITNLINKK